MRKNGGFDRSNFEKNVIDPICEDLEKCEMIKLLIVGETADEKAKDGKKKKIYYEKVKDSNRVIGYRFHWAFSARPQIATAEKVKEIKDEAIKDPVLLKVAGDIVKGKKKAGRKNTNPFNKFWPGTKTVRILVLIQEGKADTEVEFKNIKVEEIQ